MLLLQTVLARIEQDIQKEVTKNLLKKHRETRGISQSIYTVFGYQKEFLGNPSFDDFDRGRRYGSNLKLRSMDLGFPNSDPLSSFDTDEAAWHYVESRVMSDGWPYELNHWMCRSACPKWRWKDFGKEG